MFKYGMYVSMEAQKQSGEYERVLAQYDTEKAGKVYAFIFEWSENGQLIMRNITSAAENVYRADVKLGTKCVYNGENVTVFQKSQKKVDEVFRVYYCKTEAGQIKEICEKDLRFPVDAELCSFVNEFVATDKQWPVKRFLYKKGIKDYMSTVSNTPEGYDYVIGKKIELYKHQIESVQRAIEKAPYRAILADEVGLGKTIEALVVLYYAFQVKMCKRALIVVPDQLVYQWLFESREKFGLDVDVFTVYNFLYQHHHSSVIVIGSSDYQKYYSNYLAGKKWDFLIVDEVHKVLYQRELYRCIFAMSKNTKNLLLLSATPIMKRTAEYFNLLRLFDPLKYGGMKLSAFQTIMQKKALIEEDVANLVLDLGYTSTDSALEEYNKRLSDIGERIKDPVVKEILLKEDEELKNKINCAIVYLQKKYELETKFIKHRRSDILDESSKRILSNMAEFYLWGQSELSLENEVYQSLTDEISVAIDQKLIKSDVVVQVVEAFLSSMSALESVMDHNNLISVLPDTYATVIKAARREKGKKSNSRIEACIKLLSEEKYSNEKIVIFSDYFESIKLLKANIEAAFGSGSVEIFAGDISQANYQIKVNAFKKNSKVRFLICDRAGAEGRNFQFVDYIVHYDLPWSPAELEQRIGRLDRIGRLKGHTVNNIVFVLKDSIEEDLFRIYNECLDIFNESLCGIEIIYEDLWKIMMETISEKGLLGLDAIYNDIQELKEKCEQVLFEEMISSNIMEDDEEIQDLATTMVEALGSDAREDFSKSLCGWADLQGYYVSEYDNKVVCFDKADQSYIGTFDPTTAMMDNSLEWFTTSTPFIEELIDASYEDDYVDIAMLEVRDADFEWQGFISIWDSQFYEIDYLGKYWNVVNKDLKNDYIMARRDSVAYTLAGADFPAQDIEREIRSAIQTDRCNRISVETVINQMGYPDLLRELIKILNIGKREYMEMQKSRIDYKSLYKKLKELVTEIKTMPYLSNNDIYVKQRYLALRGTLKMLKNFTADLSGLLYISIYKKED